MAIKSTSPRRIFQSDILIANLSDTTNIKKKEQNSIAEYGLNLKNKCLKQQWKKLMNHSKS